MTHPICNRSKFLWLFITSILFVASLSCGREISDDLTSQHINQESIKDMLPVSVTQVTPTYVPQATVWQKEQTNPDKTGLSTPTVNVTQQNIELSRALDINQNEFVAAPDRDLYKLVSELSGDEPVFQKAELESNLTDLTVGSVSKFWLLDLINLQPYRSDLQLKAITPNAYWYFENGSKVEPDALRKAIKGFEEMIYPQVSKYFGVEWRPGIDNDPRIFLIHADLEGVAGYFSSADEHETELAPFSNEREIVYLNIPGLNLGTHEYQQVLAHELQHLIHWNHDPTEETWVNEGLSELAVVVSGFGHRPVTGFTDRYAKSLVHWPLNEALSAYYGGSGLFMHYMAEHYSTDGTLMALISEEANGIEGINNYLRNSNFNTTFDKVFKDWVIANLLDEDSGRYGYSNLNVQAKIGKLLERESSVHSSIPEYSVEYWEVNDFDGKVTIQFEGESTTSLLPVDIGSEECWWSNAGDAIDSSMVVDVDLGHLVNPVFEYSIWYDIEKNWDYGYFQISIDGGKTWNVLPSKYTSDDNPIGNAFGPGYTGQSGGWLRERIDLKNYSGEKDLFIRFQYITDDAINGSGLCIKGMQISSDMSPSIKELEVNVNGFHSIDNIVSQNFIVQIIEQGDQNTVSSIIMDDNNVGQIVVAPSDMTDTLVVAVASMAPKTLGRANYRLTVD